MQLRRQPLSAPRPGDTRPAAQRLAGPLLLLLALQGAAASGGPEDSGWLQDAEPSSRLLSLAARAALHFFNFRAASPSALQVLENVLDGRAWVNQKKEYKFDLVFTTEFYSTEEDEKRLGQCSAQVFFRNEKPRPAVNVTCSQLIKKERRQEEDYHLYKLMKQLKSPLNAVSIPGFLDFGHFLIVQIKSPVCPQGSFYNNIPTCCYEDSDSHGYIAPSLRPIWDLAFLGSSYVMWQKTTPFLQYYMSQISSVKQWKTNDDAIDFDYTVLLHEFSTQEIIPCRIHLVWYPSKPLKVKYHCQERQTPEEASGTEDGSAMALTELSNF